MWNPFARKLGEASGADVSMVGGQRDMQAVTPMPKHHEIAELERVGSTAVATLTVTELSQTQGASNLSDLLETLFSSPVRNFVLDLQNVQFMDSACLGCLTQAVNQLAATGGKIALVNPNHSIEYLFRLSRIDRMFAICQDVMSALRRLGDDPLSTG